MSKRGMTRPYKLTFSYPHMAKPSVVAFATVEQAEREIVGMLQRGAATTLYVLVGGQLHEVGEYTADQVHTVRAIDTAWRCSCGRVGTASDWESYPGEDHVERFAPMSDEV